MNQRAPAILDHLASLADTTRSRLLLLLDRRELPVSRAVRGHAVAPVDRQPSSQGPVGCRMGVGARRRREQRLHDDARARRRRAPAVGAGPRASWRHAGRGRRISGGSQAALAERRATVPGVLLVVRRPVGSRPRRPVRRSISSGGARGPGESDWIVGDLGCGTGQVSAALAPFVARVIAVDASAAMLQAARKRLQPAGQHRPPPRRSRGAADR